MTLTADGAFRRMDAGAAQMPRRAAAAGVQPQLVAAQQVRVAAEVGVLADLGQRVHEVGELLREFGKYRRQQCRILKISHV